MIVEVQDYNTQVEFPDNMAPEEIQKVLAKNFPAKPVIPLPSPEADPIPFDLDGTLAMADPENATNKSDVTAVIYPFVRSFLATGYTTAAALNRGLATMATHLDVMADYVSTKTGTEKGGLFKAAAKQYQDNVPYWQDRANKVGVSFLEELFGEAVGGAAPGVAEFALNIPYAGLLGAAKASQEGKSEIAGALTEAAKRGVLGLVFKAMHPLNQYLRAPAFGTVFGLQTAAEGGDAREIAKGVGTGMLFSLSSPGGKMGLNEIRRNLEKSIVLEEAKKPQSVEIAPEEVPPPLEIVQPGTTLGGKPITVWHGSKNPMLEGFDPSLEGTGIVSQGQKYGGTFFTSSKENAGFFADYKDLPKKISVDDLNVYGDAKGGYYYFVDQEGNSVINHGPFKTEFAAETAGGKAVTKYNEKMARGDDMFVTPWELKPVNPMEATAEDVMAAGSMTKLANKAKEAGHDALIVRDYQDGSHVSDIYVAFDKNIIKSPSPLPTAGPAPTSGGKQPWEMTRAEFENSYAFHATKEANLPSIIENGVTKGSWAVGNVKGFPGDKLLIVPQSELTARGAAPSKFGAWNLLEPEGTRARKYTNPIPADKITIIDKTDNPHEALIRQALSEGKPVPPEVLKDYPDLVPEKAPKAVGPSLAMAPEAGFRREPSSVGEASDPITRRSDLVRFLTEKLDIPIRTGRFRDKALGIFKPESEVIRTKNANDIEVISHEVGHAIEQFLYPDIFKGKGVRPFAAYDGELIPIATKPKAGQAKGPEGFAEFVRLYVTDPTQARTKAPSFYDHFEHLLEMKSPESKDILLAAREHYKKYLEQPALQMVLSQISVGATGDRKRTIHDAYTAAIDDLHPLKQIVDEMAQGRKVTASEDPYKLARLMRGWTGKVDAFLRHKPFEFKTYEDVGKSFQEIIKPIDGKLEEFRAYIVSKRTLELAGREEKVETGILPAKAREVVSKYDAEFKQTFDDLKEYQDHTLSYLRDSGVIGKDTYAKIKALNNDYVPLYRVMEQTEGKGTGAGLEARNPVKKIGGSWRDIQDPLESIIKNTYLYINMAEKNAIGEALVKMAEKNEGLGKYVEKIPTPTKGTTVSPEELAKWATDNGLAEGIDPSSVEALTIFRPSAYMPKENVISVYRDGKPELYQVHPDVARTFQALDKESVNALTELLSYPASWLRAGATLTPEFIARNPLRDQYSAFVYSKYGFVPGVDLARGVFELAGKTDVYWDWKKGGGDHSMLVSMDRSYMQDQLVDVLQKYPVRNLIRNPIEGLRVLSELGEAGTRIGEFRKGIQKEGRTKEGIQQAGFSAREVTLDFARKGASGKAMNMITAFWNAGLQGQDRMVREFIENPAGMAWKTAVAITLPSVLLAIANHDDPRYKDLPQWQKDTFWIIPTDNTIYRIPKPFELGILFGSVPERITHYLLDQDPHSFDGILKSISQAAMPGFVPTAALPIMENWANRSSFFDRPIVPQNRTDLLSEYQYGPYTSETAKAIGKVLGKLPWMDTLPISSPAKIENLIYGWTGGMGRYAMNLMDVSLETAGIVKQDYEKPAKTLADYPLIKAFVVRYPSASTENITRFYDDYGKVTKRINSFKAMQKEGRFDEAMKIMEGGDLENLNGTYQALRNVHSMVDAVTINPLMNPEEKREFTDILYMQMTDIAKAGNQYIDQIREMEKQMGKERASEPRVIPIPSRQESVSFGNEEKQKPAAQGVPVF